MYRTNVGWPEFLACVTIESPELDYGDIPISVDIAVQFSNGLVNIYEANYNEDSRMVFVRIVVLNDTILYHSIDRLQTASSRAARDNASIVPSSSTTGTTPDCDS